MSMTAVRPTRRRMITVVIAALVLALGPFLLWQGAEGGPESKVAPDGIVVVGDSITARYNDEVGDPEQGWWSVVARHYNAEVDTYAQSGSGYVRPGKRCEGTTFAERTEALEQQPSIFLIEGGRNDWAYCVNGRFRTASNDLIRTEVDDYFNAVRASMPRSTRVIVLSPPWGPAQRLDGMRVTQIIKSAAEAHDFEFVDTSNTLGPGEVNDGIHPNRAGSLEIADRVIAAIG